MDRQVLDAITAAAKSLIAVAGMTAAVATTDITKQASALHRQYGEYTVLQLSKKISSEITSTHRPGVSGRL